MGQSQGVNTHRDKRFKPAELGFAQPAEMLTQIPAPEAARCHPVLQSLWS